MKHIPAILLGCAIALPASAGSPHRIDYAAYAGDPIPQFTYKHLYNWQRSNDRTLVVWTKPSTAYLLTLRSACHPLSGQMTFHIGGVAAIEQRLVAGKGEVVVGEMHCRVDRIQPVDLAAMKLAKRG